MMFHKDGSRPLHGMVFVFGSNLAGIHGAGAAKAAVIFYDAEIGVGIGPTGNSYAIPTKSANFDCLTLDQIELYVTQFSIYTQENPHLKFFVTRVGCGLAGNHDSQIAPMFRGAINCSFAEEWMQFL